MGCRGCRCFSLHQLCLVTFLPYWRPFPPLGTPSQRQLQRQPRTAAIVEDMLCALLPATTTTSLSSLM